MTPQLKPWVIHQSDLQSWNYCPAQIRFRREGAPERQNSALAYGSVIHHAMHVLERYGNTEKAIETFLHYWHPLNIEDICPPVSSDGWIGRDSYMELRKKGVDTLTQYADYLRHDDHELLALEYEFVVPVRGLEVAGREVWLAGTIDRFAVRWYRQRETVCVDDFKSGQQKWNLRDNVQGTAYAYASWQPEFWTGVDAFTGIRITGEERTYPTMPGFSDEPGRAVGLMRRLEESPRRFTWINLKNFKLVDGGYRGPKDFDRFKNAASQVIQSAAADIFPLRIDGETCRYCPFRDPCGAPDPHYADPAFVFDVAGQT